MNARSVVWIIILTVFLSGCAATLPKEIETTDVSAIKLGQVREEPVILEHIAGRPPRRAGERAGVRVVDDLIAQDHPAGGDRSQPGQRAEQGGLA